MMEEDEYEQRPFRWNPQATFIVFLSMFAMAIPLLGVVLFARGYFTVQREAKPAVVEKKIDTKQLEEGLERMSDAHFSTTVTTTIKDGLEIEVAADDMSARVARIAELAKEAGGTALDLSEPGATRRRVMVQVPESRHELLKRAINGDRVDFSAIPAGAATKVLEVELRAP